MRVAAALHWPFIDTGTMYRAMTWLALERGTSLSDEAALGALAEQVTMQVLPPQNASTVDTDRKDYATVIVEGKDATPFLRTPAVERSVSIVSAVPRVRRRMVSLQRSLVAQNPVVMVGRDIGTVVLPDARLKVYLDASAETRARRRTAELVRLGRERAYAEVLAETIERDRIDSSRGDSPLMPAHDAVQIRTDALSEDEVVDRILELTRNVFTGEVW